MMTNHLLNVLHICRNLKHNIHGRSWCLFTETCNHIRQISNHILANKLRYSQQIKNELTSRTGSEWLGMVNKVREGIQYFNYALVAHCINLKEGAWKMNL